MGHSISITVGYGVFIPGTEGYSGESELLTSSLPIILNTRQHNARSPWHDEDDKISWYDVSEYIDKTFPLLHAENAKFMDYDYGFIVFIKNTVKTEYDGLVLSADDINTILLEDEEDQLRSVAELFEVEYDPQLWVSVSYF